jgi:hypothetical protein
MFSSLCVAYLDPGAGSLLLQALVGGFAGLCVFARHLYRSFRFSTKNHPAQAEANQVCP